MNQPLKWMSFRGIRSSNSITLLLSGILILLTLAACSGIPISYYDDATYNRLTSLKAETMLLIESFDKKPVSKNEARIEKVTLNLRKAYEYEFGKGKPNSDSSRAFRKIIELFDEDVTDYLENGPQSLGKKYFSEASVVLGQAFDIVIATENLKNRDN